ncbi:alkaline phosphatase family protein [Comamonas thiooxydans]|uniref:alkaline phosphatase family protein n=1 Tax=Comamonas thiooxydans TaxID=363952 RepID=UPI00057B69B5|nr:alkaline phosphatase family protein [Comamonas thiooxydans]
MSDNNTQISPDSIHTGTELSRRSILRSAVAAGLAGGLGASLLSACGGGDSNESGIKTRWTPKKTVIVILENKSFSQLINNAEMPYLNQLAAAGALLTASYAAPTPYGRIPQGGAIRASDPSNLASSSWTMGSQFVHELPARGSQTNYFYQFAGHNQGFLPDWFESPGSGRTTSPAAAAAYSDQYGNTMVDASGKPAPNFTTEVGLSNELVTSYPNVSLPFTTPNLGAAIVGQGLTFATFSSSLPYPSYNEKAFNPTGVPDGYARRHNPAINWINFPVYGKTVASNKLRFTLPVSANLAMVNTVDPDGTKYPGFAVDKDGKAASFTALPTVSLVVPNNMENIHTGTFKAADDWLQTHIKPYADWAKANDALLIITTDEDGVTDSSNGVANVSMDTYFGGKTSYMYGHDPITTLFFGPSNRIKTGKFSTRVDHLNVLATVLDMYGALDQFKADFKTAWSAETHPINAKWAGGKDKVRQEELAAQLLSLGQPITEVFAA